MAALGKVLAICGATAAGSASCVATGVVAPGTVGLGGGGAKQVSERPAEPGSPVDTAPTQPVSDPALAQAESEADRSALTPTPAQQARGQFGFEGQPAAGPSGGRSEFGGPSSGGGAAGGGGGSSGGGFGFEK